MSHNWYRRNKKQTYQDGIKLVGPVKVLDDVTHSGLGKTPSAPNLYRLVGDLMRHAGGAHLKQANRATKVLGLLRVRHVAHLVCDRLEPALVGLDEGDHLGKFKPDDGLVDQALAKDETLVSPLQALLDDGPAVAYCSASHGPALVVEVGQNDVYALVLLAEEVSDRDLDVVKGDIGCTRGARVAGLHLLSLDALTALDD